MKRGAAAGIGLDTGTDSFAAGRNAAERALRETGAGGYGLILAFCTGKHDYGECFRGIRSVAGDLPVIGGPAIGIITNDAIGYEGYQVGVAVLPADLTFHVAAAGGLDGGERDAGLRLGRELKSKRNDREKLILLLYDSVKRPPPPAPVLNVSSALIEGLEEGLGSDPPPIVGAGLLGRFSFDRGKQFCGTWCADQHACAALLSGDFQWQTGIFHGCKPISGYHTITRVEGPVVYEIDAEPALHVIDNLLGNQSWQKSLPLLLLTLGVNHGEKFGPYDEKSYVNRLIIGIKPEEKAIVLFEADFENGTEFQFMRRNEQLMVDSAEEGCRYALDTLRKNQLEPFFALYIDCAGRTSAFSGADREEASVVQHFLGGKVPLLGFYSGVEIAPLMGRSRGLDWTGVLLILSRKGQ